MDCLISFATVKQGKDASASSSSDEVSTASGCHFIHLFVIYLSVRLVGYFQPWEGIGKYLSPYTTRHRTAQQGETRDAGRLIDCLTVILTSVSIMPMHIAAMWPQIGTD